MSGLGEIAPKTGIDKDFAQFKFYDPTQAKKQGRGRLAASLAFDSGQYRKSSENPQV
jgi:hypothetical protein